MPDPFRPFSIGGYVAEAKLGEGGMGQVYRASHPRFPGRPFALKVLLGDGAPEPDALARFERETRALATVTAHPGIVRVFGGSIEGATPFVVMELVPGTSLAALAKDGLEPARAARLVREVCEAVHYVHEQGVIHRDLKPENVLVEKDDRPRVCDFGLARIAGAEKLTRTGTMVGTPCYSAPEQLDGRAHEADRRADVYALGAVLSYALTGKKPFDAPTRPEILKRVLVEPAVAPSRVKGDVPLALDAICLKALEKEPGDRYPDALALRDELDRFLRGEPVLARPPSAGRVLARRLARRKREVVLVLLALVGLGLVVAIRAWNERERARILAEQAADKRARVAALLDGTHALGASLATAPVAQLEKLVPLALAVGEEANLIDEHPGELAIGEALLARRDAALVAAVKRDASPRTVTEAREGAARLLEKARELAEKRVASGEGVVAGRALRALATLAAVGAPRATLGGGRLVREAVTDALLADLAAGATLGGAVGARCAWLRADLLVIAGRDEEARAALRGVPAPAPPHGRSLERALALPIASDREQEETVAKLLEEHARGDEDAPYVLSRYAARAGFASAFEHPELAKDADLALVQAALACDPPDAYRFLRWRSKEPGATGALAAIYKRNDGVADKLKHRKVAFEDAMAARETTELLREVEELHAKHDAEVEASIVRGIEESPTPLEPEVIEAAARCYRTGLATAPFEVLLARYDGDGLHDLAKSFAPVARHRSRTGTSRDYWRARSWDPEEKPGAVPARVAFDQRLAEELARDPPAVALAAKGCGRELALARRTCEALHRLEELDAGADPAAARAIAAEACVRLEAFTALGGPSVLAFRPRVRRHALAKPWADALVELDLARAYAAAVDELDPQIDAERLACAAAAIAAAPRLPHDETLLEDLTGLGLHGLREYAAWNWAKPEVTQPDRVNRIKSEVSDRAKEFLTNPHLAPLTELVSFERIERLLVDWNVEERVRQTMTGYKPIPFAQASARRLLDGRR